MRIAPVSADLLLKIALGALVVGAGVWALRRAAAGAVALPGALLAGAGAVVDNVNPLNHDNVFARSVNAFGAAVSDGGAGSNADGSWSLGAAVYDLTHANPLQVQAPPAQITRPVDASGAAYTDDWSTGNVPGAFM